MSKKVGSNVEKDSYNVEYVEYLDEDGFNRLKTFLSRIAEGQSKVYTAPFAKGQSMDTILKDWFAVLKSISDKWPTLYEFEKDLANKVGPLSVQKPILERLDDIGHYYDDIHLSSKPIAAEAIDSVLEEFSGLRYLDVRSQTNTVEVMKKSTSSGIPLMTKRRKVVQETIPCKVLSDVYHVSKMPYAKNPVIAVDQPIGSYLGAAVVGWRGQEGGPNVEDVKQRVIWMFPFAVNVCELQVYQPLIEGCQKLDLVPAWVSMESVDRHVTRLFDTKADDDLVICTDFSKFDQHFNSDMQDAARTILSGLLSKSKPSSTWLDTVFPAKYQIPLIWKYSGDKVTVMTGYHGMASGSGGTNADETLAHRALQYEAAIRKGVKLNPNSMCLGDDGILTFPGITVKDVVEVYESHGQECNVSKQYASSQDCVYLRRWHHKNYRVDGVCAGVYSTARALGRLRYLERFMDPEVWDKEAVALRQISIIENCKYHPLFTEFIQFCMKRDKYRLGIDIPHFLDNIDVIASEKTDLMPEFLGYTKTLQGESKGIAQWETVKYLKAQS